MLLLISDGTQLPNDGGSSTDPGELIILYAKGGSFSSRQALENWMKGSLRGFTWPLLQDGEMVVATLTLSKGK
jgi:hypothetical protein